MKRLGLFGHPVRHSISPAIQRSALVACGLDQQFRYDAYDLEPAALPEFMASLRNGSWRGVNLTVPFKVAAIPYLDELALTHSTGAVNTVVVEANGRLIGHNTDGPGLLTSLHIDCGEPPLFTATAVGEAVLLGSGGAARGVASALAGQGWQIHIIARRIAPTREILAGCPPACRGLSATWDDLEASSHIFRRAHLLVGCTTLGNGCQVGDPAWTAAVSVYATLPWNQLDPSTGVLDLIYLPARTPLLHQAHQYGLATRSGLGMLVAQAARSFELWTGCSAPLAIMRSAALAALPRQARDSTVEADDACGGASGDAPAEILNHVSEN